MSTGPSIQVLGPDALGEDDTLMPLLPLQHDVMSLTPLLLLIANPLLAHKS